MLIIAFAIMAMLGAFWEAYRIWHLKPMGWVKRILILVMFVMLWLAPVLLNVRSHEYGSGWIAFYHMVYFVFIVNFFYTGIIVVRDFFWIIGWMWRRYHHLEIREYNWRDPMRVRWASYIALGVALILSTMSLYSGMKIPAVRTITIETDKIDSDMTIVAVADLHLRGTLSVSKVEEIVERINELKPDMIVFVGDTIDDYRDSIQSHIVALQALNAPKGKFAVAGNHEFYVGHMQSKKALQEAGFTYLFNEGVQITPTVYLAGIPDYQMVYSISDAADVVRALSSAQDKDYKILLSHRPNFIDKMPEKMVDLQISGHTHGGQIFPGHILAWLQNDYLSGVYDKPNGRLYVSRGAGQWGPQMRFLAPSEISVIQLVSTSKTKSADTVEYVIKARARQPKKKMPVVETVSHEKEAVKTEAKNVQEEILVQEENSDVKVDEVISDLSDEQDEDNVKKMELVVSAKPVLLPLKPKDVAKTESEIQVEDIIGEPMEEIKNLGKPSAETSESEDAKNEQAFEEAKAALDTELSNILAQKKASAQEEKKEVIKEQTGNKTIGNTSSQEEIKANDLQSNQSILVEENRMPTQITMTMNNMPVQIPANTQAYAQPVYVQINNELPSPVAYPEPIDNQTFETVGSINVLPEGLVEELTRPTMPTYGTSVESVPVYPTNY